MRRIPMSVLAVAVALTASACGAGAPGDDPAVAADEASAPRTYRYESVMRWPDGAGAEPAVGRWSGAVDEELDRSEFLDDSSGCRTIVIGTATYQEIPASWERAAGKRWLRTADEAATLRLLVTDGEDTVWSTVVGESGSGALHTSLAAIRTLGGEPEPVGEEAVRGEPTTRYRARLDLRTATRRGFEAEGWDAARIDELLGSAVVDGTVDLDIWIGRDGFARRLVQRITLGGDGSSTQEHVTTTEFFDVGSPVEIEPPPAEAVSDAGGWTAYAPLVEDAADGEGGERDDPGGERERFSCRR